MSDGINPFKVLCISTADISHISCCDEYQEKTMKLKRIPTQNKETLEEFYIELGKDTNRFWEECSRMILELIKYLEENDIGTDKWVGTSHQELIFSDDLDKPGPCVVISAWIGKYHIEYSLPPEEAPWENARVVGDTDSVIEAGKMLLKSFERIFKPIKE